MRRWIMWCGSLSLLAACGGLTAGPEVASITPVPVSKDTAYTRAHRALATELFTFDVIDSTSGRMTAKRYPSSSAQMGSAGACRLMVEYDVSGSAGEAEVKTNSRWISAEPMLDTAPTVCEQERKDVLERVAQVITPPPPAP
jgi:hypothetical protein